MKVRLNPRGRFDEYQYSKKTLLTREWQTVSVKIGKALLQSEYKGVPLVESDEADAGEAEVEEPLTESDTGEQEGESYA